MKIAGDFFNASRIRDDILLTMIEIRTGKREWDEFPEKVKFFLDSSLTEISYPKNGGRIVKGYRTPDCPWLWLRDNVHMMEASVYLLEDIKGLVDFFLDNQNEDGSFHDFLNLEGELQRVPSEADLEYLAVIGAYRSWMASCDDSWLRSRLPALEKGLHYMTSHPWRWDEKYQMPKRAYTIDTWDFDIREGLEKIHWPGKIDEKTHFGIMHGDVSGLYYAWQLMSRMFSHFGDESKAEYYRGLALDLQKRANEILWNGNFYRHRLSLDGYHVNGVDEDRQLSLSNAYDMNRGLPTSEMSRSIIEEYMRRKKEGRAFAEWYSIDPPFPPGVFGEEKLKPGVYVNGGIMPLVGGELANAAFKFGFPEYGVDILRRYFDMIDSTGEAYLWYFPDGRHPTKEDSPSPEAYPTDGWGGSAMACALIEGLAGVRAEEPGFESVRLSPMWQHAGVENAKVYLEYPSSGNFFRYVLSRDSGKKSIEFEIESSSLSSLRIDFPSAIESAECESGGNRVGVEIKRCELGTSCIVRGDLKGILRFRAKEPSAR